MALRLNTGANRFWLMKIAGRLDSPLCGAHDSIGEYDHRE